MDLIHKLSIIAIIVLSIVTAGMLVQHQIAIKNDQAANVDQQADLKKSYDQRIAQDTETYKEVTQLVSEKQYSDALKKLEEVKTAHPENPLSSVYMAQIQYGQGKIASAVHSYRVAVDKEPDYIDKKTPLYIGDKIMALISEARSKLKREQKLKPGDKTISLALEDVYYLERRIAGGCE